MGLDTGDFEGQLAGMNAAAKTAADGMKDQFEAIGKASLVLGGAITGAFTAAVYAAEEERQSIASLSTVMANAGTKNDDVSASLNNLIDAQVKTTNFSDNEQRAALEKLTLMTGDYGKAVAMLPEVLDLAAAGHMDATSAANLLGKAMEGNTALLVRQFPQLRDIAAAQTGLKDAMTAAGTAQKDLITAETAYATIQDKINGLLDSAVSAQRGLIHAQESQTDAVKALNDAQQKLLDMQRSVPASAKAVADATFNLEQAQVKLTTAQENYGTSQKKYLDLNNSGKATTAQLDAAMQNLTSTHNAVTVGLKGVSDAQGKLDTVQQGTTASAADLQRAQDAVDQAQRRVRDTGWSLTDAQAAVTKNATEQTVANGELTTASGNIATAQDKVATATDNVKTSEDALAATGDLMSRVLAAVK